jgi:hypothetical protein
MKQITALLFIFTMIVAGCSHKMSPAAATAYEGDLLVSFNSAGSGINHKALDKLKAYLDDYNTKAAPQINYQIKAAGREGEKDVCVGSNGNKHFAQLVQHITDLLKGENLVSIMDHQDCSKK